ncbi:hypothetical protein JCM10212_003250 [Sporobolomyces blumeae]
MAAPHLSVSKLFDTLEGKICLVTVSTGGGSGLGEIMASALVQAGAKVYIASRKEKALKAVAERLTAGGPGSCEYIVADLGSKDGCDALVAEFKRRENKLHVLVNNSGTTWGAKLTEFPEKQGWDRVLATNVKAIYYMTAGLADYLEKDATNIDPGRIVNITSIAGLDPGADNSVLAEPGTGLWSYNSSKAAANHLTKSLAITLGSRKISVNAVAPGIYQTNMTARGFAKESDKIKEIHPMGRSGLPEDIAGLLMFLVSRAGAHISGVVINTDGGSLIGGKRTSLARL